MTVTSHQLRAARALLDWTREQLAEKSGVAVTAINKFENGHTKKLQEKSEAAVIAALSPFIEFTEKQGVRFRHNEIEVYEGPERFHEFTEFVYEQLKIHGGDVCISAVDERLFLKYRKDPDLYRRRMKDLVTSGRVTVRILASESFKSSFAEMRKQPEGGTAPTAFYAFGDNLALISFVHENPPYVVLHKSPAFAESYIRAFNFAWANAQ